jgi:hypothetical protein
MSLRTYAISFALCLGLLGVLVVIGNHLYWSASPTIADGEYIFFNRAVPDPLGRWLWISLKPLLVLAFIGACGSFYRWLKTRRDARRLGLCLVCGYDLRETPERCPECGTIPR